jgi:hypothetical protein
MRQNVYSFLIQRESHLGAAMELFGSRADYRYGHHPRRLQRGKNCALALFVYAPVDSLEIPIRVFPDTILGARMGAVNEFEPPLLCGFESISAALGGNA